MGKIYWYANTSDTTGRHYAKIVVNGQTFNIAAYSHSGSHKVQVTDLLKAMGFTGIEHGAKYKRSKHSRFFVYPVYFDGDASLITQKLIDQTELAIERSAKR